MRQRVYLVVDRYRVRSMSKKAIPKLRQGERVIALHIIVPDSAFSPSPLQVAVEVPAENVGHPPVTVIPAEPGA
jgi:hypothetical protein